MAGETERAVASGHKQAGTHAGVHAREELFTIRSVRYSLLSHDTMGRTNTQLSGTNTIPVSKKEARAVVQGGVLLLGERLGAVLGSVLAAS